MRKTNFYKPAVIFAAAMFTWIPSTVCLPAQAAVLSSVQDSYGDIPKEKENILAAVKELKDVMESSYDRALQGIAALSSEGYDYELTMDSVWVQGNPYQDFNFRQFLAAYSCILEYAAEHEDFELGEGVNQISFVRYSYDSMWTSEYIPVKRKRCEKQADGTYHKTGIYFQTEPGEIPVYRPVGNGSYELAGTVWKDLEKIQTNYADVALSMITMDEIYETFGLNREDFLEEEGKREEKIKEIMGNAKIEQNSFLYIPVLTDGIQDEHVLSGIGSTDNPVRQTILGVAASIIRKVPYEWGGKADKAGFDPTWYSFRENGKQKGLDCSGFVQWVLRTCGYEYWDHLGWTGDYLDNDLLETISQDELEPGDLGLFYPDTEKVNHIGIYLGDGYWIHCNSTYHTVTVNNHMRFSVFRRLKGIDTCYQAQDGLDPYEAAFAPVLSYASSGGSAQEDDTRVPSVEDPDIMLMAKIVQLEAYGEGYNGWVAVAEVIRNRILSKHFQDSVYEVVSAPKQFATWTASQRMSDSEVDPNIIEVCKGVLNGAIQYLGRTDVIGFRTCRPEPADLTFNGWNRYTVLGNHSFYLDS